MKSNADNSLTHKSDTIVGSSEPDVVRLASLIREYTPHDGRFELRIPGVHRAGNRRAEVVRAGWCGIRDC
jgi:hypothetical protein